MNETTSANSPLPLPPPKVPTLAAVAQETTPFHREKWQRKRIPQAARHTPSWPVQMRAVEGVMFRSVEAPFPACKLRGKPGVEVVMFMLDLLPAESGMARLREVGR